MKYTLYIDESGDFETERGQWVLAGVLIADDYDSCEKYLNRKFRNIPESLGVNSIKDFHLTEFRRRYGHSSAVSMAKKVYQRLPDSCHAIACINYTKSSLSSREKNYRVMLADLLAVCETVIPHDVVLTRLDLVVASRTIDGELQTTVSNITQEVIHSLPIALEVDLATKGLVDLMGKNIRVHMDYANNTWGLVCADFLANLNYHNRKNDEKNFLEELRDEGKYSLFESFGSFDVRRAHVAERNFDFVLALYRWVVIGYTDTDAEASIQRLLSKAFTKSGTSGFGVLFEALVEKLWRNNNKFDRYDKLSKMFLCFEKQLIAFTSTVAVCNFDNYIFRLRNIRLIVENHLGRTKEARRIVILQKNMVSTLATSPEYFHLVLDFKITEAEVLINSLQLKRAFALSVEYSILVDSYKGVWQLLLDNDDLTGFDLSRFFIKSEMSLFRAYVLCYPLNTCILFEDVEVRLNRIESVLTSPTDISRLRNYRVMLLLKKGCPKDAVDIFLYLHSETNVERFSVFDIYWFLRSVNDALLISLGGDIERITSVLEDQIAYIDLNEIGHPVDLVLRELALFEFQVGGKSKALKYIAKCHKSFNLGDSEISLFLKQVVLFHEDYIRGKVKVIEYYFKELIDNELVFSLLESDVDLSPLQKVRHFSMY